MQANEYNKNFVPIFAPDGFPDWCYTHYNERSYKYRSDKFKGWIKKLQRQLRITVDGYCGPQTIESIAEKDWRRKKQTVDVAEADHFIIIGPRAVKVSHPVITYFDDFTIGDTSTRTRKEKIKQIVTHYDVTFNAISTEKVLQDRGYSTHFIIDGDRDGTIYQCHNPTTKVALHAGEVNKYSIGIDLNNPADTKYKDLDAQKRGRSREGEVCTIHGQKIERLTYFPEQLDSFRNLCKRLCYVIGIPYKFPVHKGTKDPIYGTFHGAKNFEGIIGHYHLTKRKTDPAPLKWHEVFNTSSNSKKNLTIPKIDDKLISDFRKQFAEIKKRVKKIFPLFHKIHKE